MVSNGLYIRTTVTFLIHFSSLNFSLHIVSVALWIGSLAFFLFVFGPAVHALAPGTGVQVLNRGRRSLEILSWIAMNLVWITGVLNLISRGMASGFDFGAGYYWPLAVKLFLFLAMQNPPLWN